MCFFIQASELLEIWGKWLRFPSQGLYFSLNWWQLLKNVFNWDNSIFNIVNIRFQDMCRNESIFLQLPIDSFKILKFYSVLMNKDTIELLIKLACRSRLCNPNSRIISYKIWSFSPSCITLTPDSIGELFTAHMVSDTRSRLRFKWNHWAL